MGGSTRDNIMRHGCKSLYKVSLEVNKSDPSLCPVLSQSMPCLCSSVRSVKIDGLDVLVLPVGGIN